LLDPDPLPELDPLTRTENDLSLESVTPLVPVSVPVLALLLLARSSRLTDKGLFSSRNDLDPGFLSTMTKRTGPSETGPCLLTDLNLLSVTDPSLT
jgi:hypothetical protein